MLAGDFSDIRESSEKEGGASFNWHRAPIFNNRIEQCRLVEVEIIGGRFTWRGPQIEGYSRLFQKLNSAFCNVNWRMKFRKS